MVEQDPAAEGNMARRSQEDDICIYAVTFMAAAVAVDVMEGEGEVWFIRKSYTVSSITLLCWSEHTKSYARHFAGFNK
jgi:hypothetical protein